MTVVGGNSIVVWEPKYFSNLFGVEWEDTQLLAVAKDLDIISYEASISGGALVRTMLHKDIFAGDIDIFPHSKKGLDNLIDQFSKTKSWRSAKHAWEFDYSLGVRKTKVQIITRDTSPLPLDKTLPTFDFEHCKIGYMPINGALASSLGAPISLASKKLRLAHVRDPKYSIARALKYKKLGFEADEVIEQLVAMSIKGLTDHDFDNFTSPAVWADIAKRASSS